MKVEEEFPSLLIVGTASNTDEAFKGIQKTLPDLILTDIELGSGTIFDVLDDLENLEFGIIFITSYEKYAIKAIRLSAIDYLEKPIDLDQLRTAIQKFSKNNTQSNQIKNLLAHLNLNNSVKKLAIPTENYVELIDVDSIIYIKADINYCHVYAEDLKPILVSKTLKEYDLLLSDNPSFIRIHQSFLINKNKVRKIIKTKLPQVIMSNGDTLNVSRAKKAEFDIKMFG